MQSRTASTPRAMSSSTQMSARLSGFSTARRRVRGRLETHRFAERVEQIGVADFAGEEFGAGAERGQWNRNIGVGDRSPAHALVNIGRFGFAGNRQPTAFVVGGDNDQCFTIRFSERLRPRDCAIELKYAFDREALVVLVRHSVNGGFFDHEKETVSGPSKR